MIRRIGRLWWRLLVTGLVVVTSAPAFAQTYYKWMDERGVVHLSDQAPAGVKGVQEQVLVPPPAPNRPADTGTTADAAPATTPSGSGGASPAAARVMLESYQTPRTGAASMHVSGRVKNIGGAEATNVVVLLSAIDPIQGNPCLETEVAVSPSTIPPGEEGVFETDVDSPCLNGEAKLDVNPRWQGAVPPY